VLGARPFRRTLEPTFFFVETWTAGLPCFLRCKPAF
jgi:hypothetical protein